MEHITTKTTVSVGTKINNPSILEAKKYLKEQFNNKYDIDPHFNFLIMAMPEYRLKDIETALDKYFLNKSALILELGNLQYEEKQKFFSIPVLGQEVISFHKELINILNPFRDNYIRNKDLIRINEKKTDEEETQNILKYGYLRVLNKFLPHITIGNIQSSDNFNIEDVKNNLNQILKDLYQKELKVDRIYVSLLEDADVQSDYKWLWEKEYVLG